MHIDTLSRIVVLGWALAVLGRPGDLRAQQTTGAGSIAGVAYDSVRGRPLALAQIEVEGTTLIGLTGTDGRFRIDSIPVGVHRLRAIHPILDSIGIGLVSVGYKVDAGQTTKAELATPSAETLIAMFCPQSQRMQGPAALFGRVRDADTGTPAAKAVVSLAWYQFDLTGLRKVPKIKLGTVASDGTYRVCGLPRTLDGKVQVQLPGVTNGDIPVVFQDEVLRLRSMSIDAAGAISTATSPVQAAVAPPKPVRDSALAPPPPPVGAKDSAKAADTTQALSAPRPRGRARLSGRVLNDSGKPLVDARVQLEGSPRATKTNAGGAFSLDSLPSGSQVVSVRLLGYSPSEKEVELSAAEPQTVTITLGKFVPTLTTVVAEAQRDRALDNVGFSQRKRSSAGGFFMDASDIAKHGGSVLTEVLRASPMVRIDPSNGRNVVVNARNPYSGCVVFIVDGSPFQQMSPGDIDAYIQTSEAGAIETYSGSNTPAEFVQPGQSSCLTIVIWTKFKLEQRRKR